MGRIRTAIVAKAPLDEVYDLARDVTIYPRICPNLSNLRVIKRSDDCNYCKAEWTARAKLISLTRSVSWIQEDRWDETMKCCRFSLSPDYKGYFKKMDGIWFFKRRDDGGTEMIMDVDFLVVHPLIKSAALHNLLDKVMKTNNEAILKSIKKKAESG